MKNISIILKLISLLADGEFYSSKHLQNMLGICNTVINKHVKTVRDWGIDISIVPGKGYYMPVTLQLLAESAIRALLPAGRRLTVLSVINSTNQYLIERIGYVKTGDACVAEYQTQGRGRCGRRWVSPFGNNIYLSIYWRFKHVQATIGISIMLSIVIAELLQRRGAERVRIKWPNDIYLEEKKLAGILVEIFGKPGDIAHVVIGVGINLTMREGIATSSINQGWINLQDAGIAIDRNALVIELLSELHQTLQQFECYGLAPFYSRWQKLDNFFNRPVKLLIGAGASEIQGIARGIDHHGALLLEQQGNISSYLSGEISLRSN